MLNYPPNVSPERLRTAEVLLRELAEETRCYLELLGKLDTDLPAVERDRVEAELYASISHLRSHSEVTLECIDDLDELLPGDDAKGPLTATSYARG